MNAMITPTSTELMAAALAPIDLQSVLTRKAQSSKALDIMPGVFSGSSWKPISWRKMAFRISTRSLAVMDSARTAKPPCSMMLPICTEAAMIMKTKQRKTMSSRASSRTVANSSLKKASMDPTSAKAQMGAAEPSIKAPKMAGTKKAHSGLLYPRSRDIGTLYLSVICFSLSSSSFFMRSFRAISDSSLWPVFCRRTATVGWFGSSSSSASSAF
mmetsp:Transcript_57946/g.138038  ORF Transcript_57946/g.138038 Transcript_57946/m.138038 type:complete len:214 (+) Transcript_57946:392-1033(+)